MKKKITSTVLLAFLAMPCFFGSCYNKYQPCCVKELPGPALADNLDCALEHDAFEVGSFPEKQWWLFFNDEQLNCLVQKTLENHPQIKIADANIYLADYAAKMTRATLYPTLDFHGEIYRFKQSKTGIFGQVPAGSFPLSYTQTTVYLDFEYELDFWNKNRNLFVSQVDLTEAAIAELATAELALSIATAQAYFDLQTNLLRQSLIEKRIENRQKFLELQQLTVANRVRSHYSTLDAEREIYFLNDLNDQLNEQIDIDRHTIQLLIAGDFDECIDESFSSFAALKPFPLPCDLPLNLLAHRPEITAQLWRVDAERHHIFAAQAEYYPNVNLSAILGYQTIFLEKLFEWQSTYGYWGSAVNLPIFDAGRRAANLGTQEQNYEKAIFEYEDLLLNVIKEVLDALSQLRESYNRFEEYSQITEISEQLYDLAKMRYESHVDSYFNILDGERDLFAAQDDAIRIFGIYLQAQIRLFKALGGGFSCE